jgi:hypothetical protein
MKRFIALAALAIALSTTAARAATLDFAFSFVNFGDTVTGVVRGLKDNATASATSVEILTNSAGFGIGEYVGNPFVNSWTVQSGGITAFSFTSFGANNSAPAVMAATLALLSVDNSNGLAGLSANPNLALVSDPSELSFVRQAPAPVPLPAPALLLAAAAASLVLLRRRRVAAA